MLQKLFRIKHLKEQMQEGTRVRWRLMLCELDKSAFRTHLWQLPLSVERHQDEDVGHCQRYTTQFSTSSQQNEGFSLRVALPHSTDWFKTGCLRPINRSGVNQLVHDWQTLTVTKIKAAHQKAMIKTSISQWYLLMSWLKRDDRKHFSFNYEHFIFPHHLIHLLHPSGSDQTWNPQV